MAERAFEYTTLLLVPKSTGFEILRVCVRDVELVDVKVSQLGRSFWSKEYGNEENSFFVQGPSSL